MTLTPLFQVDAFTDQPFHGNPAAVCLLQSEMPADWMQNVAGEMNLSETAFVYPDDGSLRLRWFTPETEVELCGHATLAAAHVLNQLRQESSLPLQFVELCRETILQFQTLSGQLITQVSDDQITLDFPALPVQAEAADGAVLQALGCTSDDVQFFGRSRFDLLVRLRTAAMVRKLNPDVRALAACDARGIIVTALGEHHEHDFMSRFFAPGAGVPEDPVTGSAHCVLAPFWSEHFGRKILFGWQASKRGGRVQMEVRGDRVLLTGKAVTVLSGTLHC
jgi:PhzF family phenazine biosynthesis protein